MRVKKTCINQANICFNSDMQRLPVESSDIVSVGYEPAAKILEVEFHGGRVYQYRDVEPDIYAQFMRAESYGTFFFAHINGRYRYEKISSVTDGLRAGEALAVVSASPLEVHDAQVACEPYGIDVEPLELPVDEIQADNAEDIALKKPSRHTSWRVSRSWWRQPSGISWRCTAFRAPI